MNTNTPMTLVPLTADEKIPACRAPEEDSYITPGDLLGPDAFGDSQYFLYEGVSPSALLGNTQNAPLFRGLPDEVSLPYLLCRGSKAGALIAISSGDAARLRYTQDFVSEHFPGLPFYNTTHLLSYEALRELSPREQLEYFNDFLPNSPGSFLNGEISYFSPSPVSIWTPEDEYDDTLCIDDWCFEDEMSEKLDRLIELLKGSLSRATGASFSALPLERVMGELGIKGGFTALLQEKRLLERNKLCRPTPFGRQCGLVVRLKASERGAPIERELRVAPCALEAFKEAVSFNKAVSIRSGRERPLTGLAERLSNLENWQFSSELERGRALPAVRDTLIESLQRPIGRIRSKNTKPLSAQTIDSFIDGLEENEKIIHVNHDTSFHKFMAECLKLLKAQKKADKYTDLQDDGQIFWNSLYNILIIIREGDNPLQQDNDAGPESLMEGLKKAGRTALPCTQMPVTSYFQAIASLFDGTYPLWVCERLGLPEFLKDSGVPPQDSIAALISKMWFAFSDKDLCRFVYMMFIRPLSLLPDVQQAA